MWGLMSPNSFYRYEHLDEVAEEEKSSLNPSSPVDMRARSGCWYLLAPWISSTFVLLFLSIYLFFSRIPSSPLSSAAVSAVFETDLADARSAIEYETRTYTGAFDYNKTSGKLSRIVDDSKPQYFGDPALVPGIDAAWDELMEGEFTAMSDEEAAAYAHPDFHPMSKSPEGKKLYYFEPDMFHSLHCLNAIRRMLDHDFYDAHPELEDAAEKFAPEGWMRLHRDHCLDQIMQSIQCHGDLSASPMHAWAGFPLALGVGQTHTCRKFDKVQEWRARRNQMRVPLR